MKKYKGLDCILLVDDDEVTNFVHQKIITSLGIECTIQVVYNGLEALEFLTCTGKFSHNENFPQPGIIFLDINMPKMNGWEFLEKYKSLPEEQKAKIVMAMLTTSAMLEDKQKAINTGELKGFINKPLAKEDVERIIEGNFRSEV